MHKVLFSYKSGRERLIPKRDADLLARLGKGTYMTRDMAAQPVSDQPEGNSVDLSVLSAEELHFLAKQRGVKVHHKAGPEKVRAALREAQE